MQITEARLVANKLNKLKYSESEKGEEDEDLDDFEQGLYGDGIYVREGDGQEIVRRIAAWTADMRPRTPTGEMLIIKIVTLSLRVERAFQQESALIARRTKTAVQDFDNERAKIVKQLFDNLAENFRSNMRKLLRMPDGVSRLVDAWIELRDDLIAEPTPVWTAEHLARGVLLLGIREPHAPGAHISALSRGVWGDFELLTDSEGGDLDEQDRREWSKDRLLELVDAEIDALEAHYKTLDREIKILELDRREAPGRALFDTGEEATLLRRYDAAVNRLLDKAMKEFREVEGR